MPEGHDDVVRMPDLSAYDLRFEIDLRFENSHLKSETRDLRSFEII